MHQGLTQWGGKHRQFRCRPGLSAGPREKETEELARVGNLARPDGTQESQTDLKVDIFHDVRPKLPVGNSVQPLQKRRDW